MKSYRSSWAALSSVVALVPPGPHTPLPHGAAAVAQTLTRTSAELAAAVDRWTPKSDAPPANVVLYALYQQRIYRSLGRDEQLAAATLPRLTPELRTLSRDLLTAQHELYVLTPPLRPRAIRVGRSPPAVSLLADYRVAERRFQVGWSVLAAMNLVESKFGKIRSTSAAGAQGPMQFLPATWRRYGLGGDVHDAHDAILGAANYLHASGAPGHLRRALHAYNPSHAYVDAVLRYARQMRADRTNFYAFYCWQVFVKTPTGDRRVTGPGLP